MEQKYKINFKGFSKADKRSNFDVVSKSPKSNKLPEPTSDSKLLSIPEQNNQQNYELPQETPTSQPKVMSDSNASDNSFSDTAKRPKKRWVITSLIAVFAIIGLGAGSWFAIDHFKQDIPIPEYIRKQVDFAIFFPISKTFVINKDDVKYDEIQESVVYKLSVPNSKIPIVVSMQSLGPLTDDAKYNEFIASMHPQTSFKNEFGELYITKPDQINGDQAAILKYDGTLLFLRADPSVTKEQWQDLFSNLYVIYPIK